MRRKLSTDLSGLGSVFGIFDDSVVSVYCSYFIIIILSCYHTFIDKNYQFRGRYQAVHFAGTSFYVSRRIGAIPKSAVGQFEFVWYTNFEAVHNDREIFGIRMDGIGCGGFRNRRPPEARNRVRGHTRSKQSSHTSIFLQCLWVAWIS